MTIKSLKSSSKMNFRYFSYHLYLTLVIMLTLRGDSTATLVQKLYYRAYTDICLAGDVETLGWPVRTRLKCATYCTSRELGTTKCAAFNYAASTNGTGVCELIPESSAGSIPTLTWEARPGCRTYKVKSGSNTVPDCSQAASDGVYTLSDTGTLPPFQVYCKGGWTIFLRQVSGTVSFQKVWTVYKNGFGDLNSDHWLGNDKLHYLTNRGSYKMRVDLQKFDLTTAYAEYSSIVVDNEANNYTLHLGAYSGTAGDSMKAPANMAFSADNVQFSTMDRDNDQKSPDGSCVAGYLVGYWYKNCWFALPTGTYRTTSACPGYQCPMWSTFDAAEAMKVFIMSIKPV